MNEHEIICSEDYVDLIVEYTEEIDDIVKLNSNIFCFHDLGGEYKVLHIHKDKVQSFLNQMQNKIKFEYPLPMGLLDDIGLSHSGVESIQNQPYMHIRGRGVLIGIIDTGIDYLHPAFLHPDNTTRILRIWDQTIEGIPPKGFHLGHEYTKEDINQALQSENPYNVVDHKDTIGHGTSISGVIAGNDKKTGFIGVAPEAELIVVKVKPSKKNFKDQWMITKDNLPIFSSSDIIIALQYVTGIAKSINRPIAMNNAFGTNHGPHDDSGISGSIMADINNRRGFAIIGAVGNEGIAKHHISGILSEHTMSHDIELSVGANDTGFCMEMWVPLPDIVSVSIRSPMNSYIEMLPKKSITTETSKLLFEKTEISIHHHLSHFKNGDQLIIISFKDPTPGIWTITLKSQIYLHGRFNAWLPMRGWIENDTFFLNSDPNYTVTMPGTFSSLITVGAYNHRDESLYIHSSRGPSRLGNIRPDLVAPGVNIKAPSPNNSYTIVTGTSIASAIVTGCAALLLEWGIVRGNDPSMNTYKIKNYLIGGARREKNISYPNNIWGYGKLDLYGAFKMIDF